MEGCLCPRVCWYCSVSILEIDYFQYEFVYSNKLSSSSLYPSNNLLFPFIAIRSIELTLSVCCSLIFFLLISINLSCFEGLAETVCVSGCCVIRASRAPVGWFELSGSGVPSAIAFRCSSVALEALS